MAQAPDSEELRRELDMAAAFQRAVLPEPVPLAYLKTAVIYRPHGDVSGDVYHFLLNRERELGVFVGDATGHGVAAALLTMMVLLGLDGIRRNLPTDDTLRQLNRILASRKTGLSVTGVFFRITPGGKLTVAHAGHPSLLIIPADGSPVVRFEKGGCPLGVFEDEPVPYEEEHYQLNPGDQLFVYTDAVLEWESKSGEAFGMDRLARFLDQNRRADINKLNEFCLRELTNHSQGNECGDDLTMLAFEFTGIN